MESPETIESRKLILKLMDAMGKKGFFFVGLVGYNLNAKSDKDIVRVGTSIDFYKDPKIRPAVIRMLRNAATILEAGEGDANIEVIGNW